MSRPPNTAPERFYVFDMPESLTQGLEPFKVDFPEPAEPAEADDSSSEEFSDSSSEESEEEDEAKPRVTATNLSYTQYADESEESMEAWQWANRAHITGTPFVYYAKPHAEAAEHNASETGKGVGKERRVVEIPSNKVLAIYKAWFTTEALVSAPVAALRALPVEGRSCVLLVSSGNFAGAIIEHRRQRHKTHPLQNVVVVESKTFHRYTTRRKQGGSQSASDAARGKANSAGSTIRRANERALQDEIRALLASWAPLLAQCTRVFYKAPGRPNKQLIAGYVGAPLAVNDERLVQIPFATKRPTLVECKQAWLQLTQATIVDPPKPPVEKLEPEKNKAKAEAQEKSSSQRSSQRSSPAPADHNEVLSAQIVELVKRSKLPALRQVLQTAGWDFALQPAASYRSASTPLQLAVALDKPNVVTQLLAWGADPTQRTGGGQALGDVAKTSPKAAQALQISRHELGEARWDWKQAKVGPATSRDAILAAETQAKLRLREEQRAAEAEQAKQEHEQRMERLISKHGSGRLTGGLYEASRGLSEADLRQVERERRARAAEARLAKNK